MINLIFNLLKKNKAIDINIIICKNRVSYADYIIIATSSSNTHAKSMIKNVIILTKKKLETKIDTISGLKTDWALIEINNIIINIMSKESRKLYDLDSFYKELC